VGSLFTQKSVVLILSYAPVGFGHLRVTDALYHGLPAEANPLLLGAQDKSVGSVYRFISIHPLTRLLMTWFQRGVGESVFDYYYKEYFRSTSHLLYDQLVTILHEQIALPKVVVVVATHFALAYQLVEIKKRLEKENNIHLVLVVQVTDDSPQKLWCVDGADMIVVPSEHTKHILRSYCTSKETQFVVNAYPVSPFLSNNLTQEHYADRIKQLTAGTTKKIHVAIPLSGTAVGTTFFRELIADLHTGHMFMFHIVAKKAPYTDGFISKIIQCDCIDLHISHIDREVVDMYEDMYKKEIISLEVTKPSEQAFKALLHPNQVGGSILLFTEFVGRQEADNMDFLRRHHLVPTVFETEQLIVASKKNIPVSESLLEKAKDWRGLVLPAKPSDAAQFIIWAREQGILSHMMQKKPVDKSDIEVQPDGVRTFWEKVESYLKNHIS
jgi:hypothetical protein